MNGYFGTEMVSSHINSFRKRTPDIDCSTTRKRQANQESNE